MDESGDHVLSNVDPASPVFPLYGIIFSQQNYEAFCLLLGRVDIRLQG